MQRQGEAKERLTESRQRLKEPGYALLRSASRESVLAFEDEDDPMFSSKSQRADLCRRRKEKGELTSERLSKEPTTSSLSPYSKHLREA